jgi:hypothetical protein
VVIKNAIHDFDAIPSFYLDMSFVDKTPLEALNDLAAEVKPETAYRLIDWMARLRAQFDHEPYWTSFKEKNGKSALRSPLFIPSP